MDLPTTSARPGIRRKSSASNLLFFKNGLSPTAQPPVQTPTAKEWDSASLFSEATVATMATIPPPPASLEAIREMLSRRVNSLVHIKRAHEGNHYWLNTVLISPYDLNRVYKNDAMKQRTYRFTVLGMSLSNLFDIHQPQDFLRSLTNLLTEYEQFQDENYKPRVRNFFKASKVPRRGGGSDFSHADAGETSYLNAPNIPFSLDYFQVIFSFCDILTEVYQKIRNIIGVSPLSSHSFANPGVGYWMTTAPANPGFAQLLDSGAPSGTGTPSGQHTSQSMGGLASPPPQWSAALGETINKVDTKLKKIVTMLLKELDAIARNAIKDELSSLDPLLRNLSQPSMEGIAGLSFDFDVI